MTVTEPQRFVMYGAREAMLAGLVHIEEQVKAIEEAVLKHQGLALDLAKTLIESTCRAVLKDRGIAYADADDLPKLFRAVRRSTPFLPANSAHETEVRRSLEQTLSGLATAVQGICELRNQCGFASHGSAEARPRMTMAQALLVAEAADAIVGFVYRVHAEDRSWVASKQLRYDDHPEFNVELDEEAGPIDIREASFRASEVLFTMEPETYRIYLAEFDRAEVGTGMTREQDLK